MTAQFGFEELHVDAHSPEAEDHRLELGWNQVIRPFHGLEIRHSGEYPSE
jgi:hypothetical protein